MLDEIVFARLGADAAFAAARLVAVDVHRSTLDIPGVADGDSHFFVFDQIFEFDLFDAIDDLRAAVVAVGFHHFAKLGHDDGFQFFLAAEDFAQLGDAIANFFQFLEDFIDRKARQAVELQFEKRVDLVVAQTKNITANGISRNAIFLGFKFYAALRALFPINHNSHAFVLKKLVQILATVRAAGRPANDSDHLVEIVERNLIAKQNVLALFGFAQVVLGAPADNVDAVRNEEIQQLDQAELA